MLQRYGGGNMDEGWTRLMFEQFNVTSKPIMDAEIKAGGLESKYDTIVLPADSIAAMTGERPPRAGTAAVAAAVASAAAADNTPAEFRSGFGAEGVKALQAFVQKGGTLLTFAKAGDLPIQRFGLPVRNIVDGCRRRSSGRRVDAARHLQQQPSARLRHAGRGPGAVHGRRTGLRGRRPDRSQDVEILTTYVERDILQSGWLLGEQVIAKKAAAVSVKHGARQGGADRFPSAASRPDARHVQDGVQRAVERAVGRATSTTTAPQQ